MQLSTAGQQLASVPRTASFRSGAHAAPQIQRKDSMLSAYEEHIQLLAYSSVNNMWWRLSQRSCPAVQ